MSVAEAKMSDRIKYIHDRRFEIFDKAEIHVRQPLYEEAYAAHPDEPRVVQMAYGFKNFLEHKKIHLEQYDILAGNAYRYTYDATMAVRCPLDYDPRYRPAIYMDPTEEAEECIKFHGYEEGSPENDEMKFFATATLNWLYKHWECGHIIPGYFKVIHKGFGGILKDCEAALESCMDDAKKPYALAMKMVTEASIDYIRRYEALAHQRAEETAKPEWRDQMLKIEAMCHKLATEPADTFAEAIQLVWFTHELLYAETAPASISFGRFDQYMYPYYKKDIEEGRLTKEEAMDYLDALWIKFSHNLHAYQNMTIGGRDENGNDESNELTKMIMVASRTMRFDQPLLCLRYDENTPQDVWEEAVSLLSIGGGFPAFFSNEGIAKAKLKMNESLEDAYDFGLVGCVEPTCPGKEYSKTEVLRINWPKVLELMINDGRSTKSNDIIKPHESKDLDSIKTFDELYSWYKKELLAFTATAMDCVKKLEPVVPAMWPTPFLSLTMEGCIERNMDVTAGGTKYNNAGISACGQANAVDALYAIKTLVYDQKKYKLSEMAEAAYANYEGYEDMLADINNVPKYGNDIDDVDALMVDLVKNYAELVDSTKTVRGGKFQFGLYSVEDHAKMGKPTGATLDGRLAGKAFANAFAPVQGKDHEGPTAIVNSSLKTDMSVATNGMVLDLKFNPKFFDQQTHVDALHNLINTFFKEGGLEIQFNVVDRATLIEAQKHPEEYMDLVVRVSGFSAYFHSLMKETQDEIIARTEYEAI